MFEIKSFKLNIVIGSAAAIAVFITILYMGMFNTGKYSPEIVTACDQSEYVFLPDSSSVLIGSNSRVKYHCNKITGTRNVVLQGSAFVDVKNIGKKFKVDIIGGQILVEGTQFYVHAYTDNYVNVDCVEGEINFKYGRFETKLQKGQGIKVFEGSVTGPYSIECEKSRDKIQGNFFFKKVSMKELFYLIEKYFDYSVEFDRYIGKQNFSGSLQMNNLNNCMHIVSTAMNFEYVVDENKKVIHVTSQ